MMGFLVLSFTLPDQLTEVNMNAKFTKEVI